KDATLIVTDGDPRDSRTHVELEVIQGRAVPLTSRHTRLNEKYKTKYARMK
ncbi:MAG: imidazolonepropionase, partial [Calditrichaeota bacterium]